MFVTTADPVLEPLILTVNPVLSLLAVDYPADKLACYVSDDGASLLTFYSLVESSKFAKIWVPFCKKYNVQIRAPFRFFTVESISPQDVSLEFQQEWKKMKYMGHGTVGIQGPFYGGTGCFHRRKVIYGLSPDHNDITRKLSKEALLETFGRSIEFTKSAAKILSGMKTSSISPNNISSCIETAYQVAGCDYEYGSSWGREGRRSAMEMSSSGAMAAKELQL
ncbi:Cellulose synthase-like protein B6 [Camellia lanceoleosa]|uniref:Cellulose synthase-like protein B6 n=1 Tax=Camellia lanceoleosa TaxID=1840588 RepID=A0ACC0HCV2_9ERIC|nr:Cellulose synthase-like protein B6 [Camellia lanceoleosa]